ncbi:ribosome recycling factor [Acidimicrobiia bacterium]|nr:ribosome recycling factor [Acidimicrobiia bacterium]
MTQAIITDVESNMKNSVNHLIEEFTKIRTGRANPALVTNIQVDYYGTKTPLQQLASISVPDPKLLLIQPFDKGSFDEIEQAIQNSDIGLNPATDGDVIRIPIPSLSEERRKELTKVASKFTEDSKISIRSHRRTGIDELNKVKDDMSADDVKRFETQIQELTDKYVKKVDELLSVKQNELLEV